MKRLFALLVIVLYIQSRLCAKDKTDLEQNPNVFLNPQDVPIFYENSPLAGMKSFTVITSFLAEDTQMQKRIQQSIEKTLKRAGEVTHLKDNDMRGFASGNILLIQIRNVVGWDENPMPISRISLNIETSVFLEKTGMKTFPMVWSINTFVQKAIDSSFADDLAKAAQKLVEDFAQNYRYANRDQTDTAVFYFYD